MINDGNPQGRLPNWLRAKGGDPRLVHQIKSELRRSSLRTVCEEARCPNISECFSRGTATFMIMGRVCTRSCEFCAVENGQPNPLDPHEPEKVAAEISRLNLSHAVVTSVSRDDLPDGGASHFAQTIREIRMQSARTSIEVLTPDFDGRESDIALVCSAGPDVFNHNIETVEKLTVKVRNRAGYRRSLDVLSTARRYLPKGRIKSGMMVGLGETMAEVEEALFDLKEAGVDCVTIGQYLRPSKNLYPVIEYVNPQIFSRYEELGKSIGIKYMFCGPLVRSSYLADKAMV